MVSSADSLELFLRDAPKELAVDTETTGLTWSDSAFMISYAWESDHYRSGYIDIRTDPDLADKFKQYLIVENPNTIWHNAKFDFHKLGFYPTDVSRFDDTCLMIYLLNEHHVKGLKAVAKKLLGKETDEDEALKVKRRELKLVKADGYGPIPVDILAPYAVKDAEFTIELHAKLANAIAKIPEVAAVYELEKQLLLDVCVIERNGLAVDKDYCRHTIKEFGDRIVVIENRIAELVNKPVGMGPNDFNPRSPQQLLAIFGSMGYNVASTGVAELATIDHELAKLIVEMRQLNKLRSTYLEPMLQEQVDGILHPNFNLTSTVTKRFSSSEAKA